MSWLLYSLSSAFFGSIITVFSKRGAQKVNILSAVWAQRFFSIFIILPFVLFNKSSIPQSTTFWWALIATCSLNTITSILFVTAIKDSPLSLTTPITAFASVFLLITSPLMLSEYPSYSGILGVVLVAVGFYVLNIDKNRYGLLEPIKAISRRKGSLLMLLVAISWSITSNLDKIAVKNSNPLIFSLLSTVVLTFSLGIILRIKKVSMYGVIENGKVLAPIGIANGLANILQMIAISLTQVPYFHAVKETGIIFGVIWGYLFFKEKNIKERLLGASIMGLGVIAIILG